ncbi:MAG: Ig-like domain-containing protein [Prevotellaceae bacterium]|nr:Ig-like domain-containing protein [Prevotellaceae bacterium]
MRTLSTLAVALPLSLGFASCGGDGREPENTKSTKTTVTLAINHPKYANGALNVILGSPVTFDSSNVEVSLEPKQAYRLELVPEANGYFTFTSGGTLTGIKEGSNAGEITVRALTGDGKMLASKIIPVNVVGMLITVAHASYVNDTFRVTASEGFILAKSDVKIEPENPAYSVKFREKSNRYFSFSGKGIFQALLDGTGAIEVLALNGADTLKVQPFNVKITPRPDWVTAVKGDVSGVKTIHFQKFELENPKDASRYFTVTGGANKALRFTSSNAKVATVDENSGMVTVKSAQGYAFIRATAADGSERADSIRVTAAKEFPGHSCDWNLCNILTNGNREEDSRYVSCRVWDGNVATAWVYRLNRTFARTRYPNARFLMGVYGKELMPGDYNDNYPRPDWVMGGADKVQKKETNWGVWAANLDASVTLKEIIVTRGFYTDEKGRKIFQSGTMYLEFWDNNAKKCIKLGKHTFTSNPNDNEWIVDLTQPQGFEEWDVAGDATLGVASYPNGATGTELQMMFSAEGATPASDGCYYWAIADVLLFE